MRKKAGGRAIMIQSVRKERELAKEVTENQRERAGKNERKRM